MRIVFLILLFTCACINIQAQVIIKIIAGQGKMSGYSGDGNSATTALLNHPQMICLDKFENVYFTDASNNRVRKIDILTGVITTIAGNGIQGYTGDGGPATDAQLFIPTAICSDADNNIYISDALNRRVRKITSSGIIKTIAGNGTQGNSGDDGPATDAQINSVTGLCTDKNSNIYLVDIDNNNVRKIDVATGIIVRIAGTGTAGYSGDGQSALNATLNQPCHPSIDTEGNIFITDLMNSVIRKVDGKTGIISTIAGTSTEGYTGENGLATNANLKQPYGIFIDKNNNIFFAEYPNGTIRRIDGKTGMIKTVAGMGVIGYSGDGGPATDAKMAPVGVCVDHHGTIFIADAGNHVIWKACDTSLDFTAVNEVKTGTGVSVYPNPVSNELTIEGAEGCEVSVWNMVGQQVSHIARVKKKEVVNIAGLPAGMYMVQVVNNETKERTTRKVVKAE